MGILKEYWGVGIGSKLIEKAIEKWEGIRNDTYEIFSKSRLHMGAAYMKLGNNKKAIVVWETITPMDSESDFIVKIIHKKPLLDCKLKCNT